MKSKQQIRDALTIALNIIIVVFVITGTCVMLQGKAPGSGLTAKGIRNLRYFTVLSNEFCGIVAAVWLVFRARGKRFPVLFKLMAVAAVGLTFLIVAAFLQPLYSGVSLYRGGNLWFHLIVPVTGMIEFVLLPTDEKIPFRFTLYSAILALVYGTGYLGNIMINGIGTYPKTNDWYGFLNWGYPIGLLIFAVIVLLNWGMACLLRLLNHLAGKVFS